MSNSNNNLDIYVQIHNKYSERPYTVAGYDMENLACLESVPQSEVPKFLDFSLGKKLSGKLRYYATSLFKKDFDTLWLEYQIIYCPDMVLRQLQPLVLEENPWERFLTTDYDYIHHEVFGLEDFVSMVVDMNRESEFISKKYEVGKRDFEAMISILKICRSKDMCNREIIQLLRNMVNGSRSSEPYYLSYMLRDIEPQANSHSGAVAVDTEDFSNSVIDLLGDSKQRSLQCLRQVGLINMMACLADNVCPLAEAAQFTAKHVTDCYTDLYDSALKNAKTVGSIASYHSRNYPSLEDYASHNARVRHRLEFEEIVKSTLLCGPYPSHWCAKEFLDWFVAHYPHYKIERESYWAKGFSYWINDQTNREKRIAGIYKKIQIPALQRSANELST